MQRDSGHGDGDRERNPNRQTVLNAASDHARGEEKACSNERPSCDKPPSSTGELTKRFDNPSIRHRTAQIALDGSQKLPQRVIATAVERLRQGKSIDHLMMVPAAWMAACEARGGKLPAGLFSDPLDAKLGAIFASSPGDADLAARVFEAAGFAQACPSKRRWSAARQRISRFCVPRAQVRLYGP